jgi:nucleoside-diphosphate-sugar epimerase
VVCTTGADLRKVIVKILITGATGFVGSHLARALAQLGHQVKGLARKTSDTSLLKSMDIEVVEGDVRDATAMKKAVRDCQCVYHVAAKTTKDHLSKKEYRAHNVQGTRNVAQAALEAGVSRLVYAGSIGVYGTFNRSSIDENTAVRPDSFYRETKLGGENEVLSLHRRCGLPAVVARLGSVYGPGSCNWLLLCRKILKGNFRIVGAGQNYDQMVYIDDLVEGLRRCGETDGVEGRTYIITGPELATLRDVLGLIGQELGATAPIGGLPIAPFLFYKRLCSLTYRSFGVELPRSHYYDLFFTDHIFRTTKAQKELSYFPKVSLRDGFHRLLEWYRESGYLPAH